jgi:hypothetical protein
LKSAPSAFLPVGRVKLFLYSDQNAISDFVKNDQACGNTNRCPIYAQTSHVKFYLAALRVRQISLAIGIQF